MPVLGRRNTIAQVQMPANTFTDDPMKLASNDDLEIIDSEATSNTSDELSQYSETYDFMQIYMPFIRPAEPTTEDERLAEEKRLEEENKKAKPGKGGKGKKGISKQTSELKKQSTQLAGDLGVPPSF